MSTAIRSDKPVPKGFVIAAAAMMVFTVAAAATARWTGFGRMETPAFTATAAVDLRFDDRADGGVAVTGGGHTVVLDPGTNGFVRGVLRGLARDRRMRGLGPEAPFRLVERSDGWMLLVDPATGRVLDLGAFGATNADAFRRFLR